jgi:hypothetical protein
MILLSRTMVIIAWLCLIVKLKQASAALAVRLAAGFAPNHRQGGFRAVERRRLAGFAGSWAPAVFGPLLYGRRWL